MEMSYCLEYIFFPTAAHVSNPQDPRAWGGQHKVAQIRGYNVIAADGVGQYSLDRIDSTETKMEETAW